MPEILVDLLEAIRACRDGEYEAFQTEIMSNGEFRVSSSGQVSYFDTPELKEARHYGIHLYAEHLLGKFRLLRPIPQVEEREVKRWLVITKDGTYLTTTSDKKIADSYLPGDYGRRIIELTGIDHVPVKRKVKRRVSWEEKFTGNGTGKLMYSRPKAIRGKSGTLTFEWEEEP